jgi:hypothetical protein
MEAWSGDPIPAQYLKGRTGSRTAGNARFQAKAVPYCHALGGTGESADRRSIESLCNSRRTMIRQVIQGGREHAAMEKT